MLSAGAARLFARLGQTKVTEPSASHRNNTPPASIPNSSFQFRFAILATIQFYFCNLRN